MGLRRLCLPTGWEFLRVGRLCRCGFTNWIREGSLLRQSLPSRATAVNHMIGRRVCWLGGRLLLGLRLTCRGGNTSAFRSTGALGEVIASANRLLALSTGTVLSAAASAGSNPFFYFMQVA